jgi:hypothetical protein
MPGAAILPRCFCVHKQVAFGQKQLCVIRILRADCKNARMPDGKYGPVHSNAPTGVGVKRGRPKGAKDKQPRKRSRIPAFDHEANRKKVEEGVSKRRHKGRSHRRSKGDSKQDGEESSEESDWSSSEGSSQASEQDLEVEQKEQPDIQWPAHVMLVAMTQSGKTNAIMNIIKTGDFDEVFVVTTTEENENLNTLVRDRLAILNNFTQGAIEQIVQYARKTKEEHGRWPRQLIIFDDFVGIDFNFKTNPMMNLLCSAGRNMGINILFSCQTLEQIPTMLRRNAHYLFLGRNNDDVIDAICSAVATPSMGGKDNVRKTLRQLEMEDGYRFFYVDKKKRTHFLWQAPKLLVKKTR